MAKVLVKLTYYHWVDLLSDQPDNTTELMRWRQDALQMALLRQLHQYPAAAVDHEIVRVQNDQA